MNKWDKVFKNGARKICRRQPLKNLKGYGLPYLFKFFKGCLLQILIGSFLNTWLQVRLNDSPEEFKPVYYRRYVADVFALFHLPGHLEKFTNHSNSEHRNINFSHEKKLIIPCLF